MYNFDSDLLLPPLAKERINKLLGEKNPGLLNFFLRPGKSKNKNINNLRNYSGIDIHIESECFFIEFNQKQYKCIPMEKNGRMIYQIKFPSSSIYLTQAKARSGEIFWTAIPPDSKLNHIVPVLGKQIENKKS